MSACIASDSRAIWNFRLYEVGRDIDVQLCGSLQKADAAPEIAMWRTTNGSSWRQIPSTQTDMFFGGDGLLSWSNDGARWARDVPVRD